MGNCYIIKTGCQLELTPWKGEFAMTEFILIIVRVLIVALTEIAIFLNLKHRMH